jgi:hypothetical protein
MGTRAKSRPFAAASVSDWCSLSLAYSYGTTACPPSPAAQLLPSRQAASILPSASVHRSPALLSLSPATNTLPAATGTVT